jgi:hypothetical protein
LFKNFKEKVINLKIKVMRTSKNKKKILNLKKFEIKGMSLNTISGGNTAKADIIMDLTFEIKK